MSLSKEKLSTAVGRNNRPAASQLAEGRRSKGRYIPNFLIIKMPHSDLNCPGPSLLSAINAAATASTTTILQVFQRVGCRVECCCRMQNTQPTLTLIFHSDELILRFLFSSHHSTNFIFRFSLQLFFCFASYSYFGASLLRLIFARDWVCVCSLLSLVVYHQHLPSPTNRPVIVALARGWLRYPTDGGGGDPAYKQ